MQNQRLQSDISRLIAENGLQAVLHAVSEDISRREQLIREEHDRNLSCAFEFMFPVMVKTRSKLGKKLGSLVEMVLNSIPVRQSIKIIKADSPNHSQSVKEAYQEWVSWDKKTGT